MIWANYCRHEKASTWEHHVLSAPCSESYLLFFVCAHACTRYVCLSLTDVISFLVSLLTAYYAICDLKTFGEAAGKKWLFDSSWLLHSGSSRASWKQSEILLCWGREELRSTALMRWSSWTSDLSGSQVKDQEQPKSNECEFVFGKLSSPNCEAGWIHSKGM